MPSIEHLRPALADNDPQAWRTLVRELAAPLFRYVRPMVLDDDSANELVQRTFIRLHGAKLKAQGSLRTFCFFIATNLARDAARNAATRAKHEQEATMQPSTADPETAAIAREAWQRALALPLELREVILLRFGQGFTAAEAANALGIPEGTVKTRQRDALERLRQAMPAAALPMLEQGMVECGQPTPVPSLLVSQVEAMVMASIGTKAGATAGIMALVVLLMLGSVVVALGASYLLLAEDSLPPAGNRVAIDPKPERRNTRGAESNVSTNRATPVDPTGGPDQPEPEPEPDTTPEDENAVKLVFKGRVIDEAGRGIAGAEVSFELPQPRRSRLHERYRDLARGTPAGREQDMAMPEAIRPHTTGEDLSRFVTTPAAVRTAADGSFELKGLLARVRTASVKLAAIAAGYSPAGITLGGDPVGLAAEPVELRLQALDRCVVFKTKPSVESVLCAFASTEGQMRTSTSYSLAMRAPAGAHQVWSDAGMTTMTLKADGFAPVRVVLPAAEGSIVDAGTIELPAGRALQGVVVDESGAGIGDAIVFADQEYALSGADGAFEMRGLPEGEITLSARHGEYAQVQLKLPQDASRTSVRMVMPRGVNVSVHARVPAGAKVVRVAMVNAEDARHLYPSSSDPAVDEHGLVTIKRVPPGKYLVRAFADGKPSVPKTVTVAQADVAVEIEFGAGGVVQGLVTGRDGKPVADTRVELYGADMRESLRTRTNELGMYRLEDVPDGDYVVFLPGLDLSQDEATFARRRVNVKDASEATLDIDLSLAVPGNVFKGRVTMDRAPAFEGVYVMGTGLNTMGKAGMCDEQGSFTIEGIPPGAYYAWFLHSRKQRWMRMVLSFDGWTEVRVHEQDVTPASLVVNVTGEGLDASKLGLSLLPLIDEPLGPDPALAFLMRTPANAKSGAKLEGLVPGRCRLLVVAEGFAASWQIIEVGTQSEVTVTLHRLSGAVECSVGCDTETRKQLPAEQAGAFGQVAIYPQGESMPVHYKVTSLAGQRPELFQGLPPGRYTMRLYGPMIEASSTDFEIAAGETTRLAVAVRLAARAVVQVDGADPGTVAGACVRLYDAASGSEVRPAGRFNSVVMDAPPPAPDGTVAIGPLAAGSYRAVIEVPGYKPATVNIHVSRGQTVQLQATLVKE